MTKFKLMLMNKDVTEKSLPFTIFKSGKITLPDDKVNVHIDEGDLIIVIRQGSKIFIEGESK
jgi:hypothetical protein